jgi:hypothetical protein
MWDMNTLGSEYGAALSLRVECGSTCDTGPVKTGYIVASCMGKLISEANLSLLNKIPFMVRAGHCDVGGGPSLPSWGNKIFSGES